MFTIGEFSKVTGMTVKTLRFYHEAGLIVPSFVDEQTGYRYYHEIQLERARAVATLRALEFPVTEIAEILHHDKGGDDERVLEAIERRKVAVDEQLRHLRRVSRSLATLITEERQVRSAMAESAFEVQELVLPPLLVAGVRMKGRYQDCCHGFSKIAKNLGRYISGTPFLLHYDSEYRELDADFEACMPVKAQAQGRAVDGISIRELPGGRCLALRHKGPYEQLGPSYARIFGAVKAKGCNATLPTREVYLKGPGMIFKGNPKNYLTEIQVLVEPVGT